MKFLERSRPYFGGGGDAPKQPKLLKVPVPATADTAKKFDVEGFKRSDEDFASRFPTLPPAREFMLSDSIARLGGEAPAEKAALEQSGLTDAASRIEGGDEFKTSRNMGAGVLDKQARDRNFFETLLAMNPPRTAGLSGEDVTRIAISNSGNANQVSQAAYGTQLSNYNSAVAQSAQNYGALTGLISGLATNYAKFYAPQPSPYTNFGYGGAYTPAAGSNIYDIPSGSGARG